MFRANAIRGAVVTWNSLGVPGLGIVDRVCVVVEELWGPCFTLTLIQRKGQTGDILYRCENQIPRSAKGELFLCRPFAPLPASPRSLLARRRLFLRRSNIARTVHASRSLPSAPLPPNGGVLPQMLSPSETHGETGALGSPGGAPRSFLRVPVITGSFDWR